MYYLYEAFVGDRIFAEDYTSIHETLEEAKESHLDAIFDGAYIVHSPLEPPNNDSIYSDVWYKSANIKWIKLSPSIHRMIINGMPLEWLEDKKK